MRDEWDWCYRLFFSVDVVGSTAVKTQDNWIQAFEDFFEEFPKQLLRCYETLDGRSFPKVRELPNVWKFVGDEILLTAALSNHLEALTHVVAFKDALRQFSDVAPRQSGGKQLPPLPLKGTLWTAGFPVENASVKLGATHGDGQRPIVDYLGPGVDLGFRLATFADARRIPVSVQLACLLLDAVRSQEKHSELAFRYDGRRELKGVLRGTRYPIICVDRRDGVSDPEDQLLGEKWVCSTDTLVTFLSQFLDQHGDEIRRPFIVSDKNGKYGDVPPKIQEERDRLMSEDPDVVYSDTTQADESEAARPDAKSPRMDDEQVKLAREVPRRKRSKPSRTGKGRGAKKG